MKIYLLEQSGNTMHNSFDAIIVCADNEQEAKDISCMCKDILSWDINLVTCTEIGKANKHQIKGEILASFNAE